MSALKDVANQELTSWQYNVHVLFQHVVLLETIPYLHQTRRDPFCPYDVFYMDLVGFLTAGTFNGYDRANTMRLDVFDNVTQIQWTFVAERISFQTGSQAL